MNYKKKKKLFAEGICFEKLFLIFVMGCIFGAFYEEILTFGKRFINGQTLIWEYRRGVIYGPFSPIYGLGATLMTYFLARNQRPMWKTFTYAAILGGVVEYLLSFLQETYIGTVSWDYSNHFLNINGRTTIPFMIAWGILGLIFVELIYPFISKCIENIPIHFGKILTNSLVVFLSLDMLISWTALYRQTTRREGRKPATFIGEIYDIIYPDQFLEKFFSNMKSVNRGD